MKIMSGGSVLVEQFGARLSYWRMLRGLTQLELADAVDVSATHISSLECGRTCPSLRMVECLLDALNVDIGTFFEGGRMKIIRGGSVIAELRDAPKDFNCTNKAGVISVATPAGAVVIGSYDTARASEIVRSLYMAYFRGDSEFVMPAE